MVRRNHRAVRPLVGNGDGAAAVAHQHVERTEALAERALLLVVEVLRREDQQCVLEKCLGDDRPVVRAQLAQRHLGDDRAERRVERLDDWRHVSRRCRDPQRSPRR